MLKVEMCEMCENMSLDELQVICSGWTCWDVVREWSWQKMKMERGSGA